MSGPPLAVVTGASSGIGAEFTQRLLDRGYRVLAVARRADRLVALEESTGGRVIAEPCDLTVDGATDAVAKRAEELGGADLLVCNAGRGLHGRFVDTERCDTLAMLQLNVLSSVDLAARIVPTMVRRGSGGVIVVASTLGFVSVPNLAAYGASKAFLLSFAEALSTELKGTGVRAMALCPGPTISEFSEVAGLDGQVEKTPGHTTTAEVVSGALRAWDAGRVTTVPGTITRLMTGALAYAPRSVGRMVMERVFR
ncbi:SDR family NAD(P)-dependent oxidoreductase [Salinispora arenicola]|uniref:Short-chain dehydrogenase/reductase SDR n=1 Tax=Salinispora arenicola (strain CNS-205) TaxID=391037 RepID=A8LW90_SALAI|nr:SDR family NAD(P)-dependent oxidoreductase [Salinispora arenicola]NIL56405.1 SDR family NAD(P)-dependent oxidoreductase [Salinispora arenicola]NIL62774.1 SDR family NAD(P)-dependent oxidoreductase [Salinispora arenicola]